MMGHLLVIAGSRGKSGAATIAARAALRSGAGLVTVASPRSGQAIVAGSQAELMAEPLPETKAGTLARPASVVALRLLAARDALAMGPGLGTDAGTRTAVDTILSKRRRPCVLDADGLNAFATDRRARARLRAGASSLVLTPHPGEAARLLDSTAAAIQADRLGSARRLAETGDVVLKGRRTIVARADGRAAFAASGNPGMATAGTGDALTGVIGALLARGMDAFDAARLGTYVHGAAGDLAAERRGEEGLIAGDLVDALPDAWREICDRRLGVERWTPGA
jgi:NAD(P)H-hydrate epimerase